MIIYLSYVAVLLFIPLFIHAKPSEQNYRIKNIIQSLQHQFAPDPRTAIFNITYTQNSSDIKLLGETDQPAAKYELLNRLHQVTKKTIIDSIHILPAKILGIHTYGIIVVDVGDVRRDPDHRSELISQVLMGSSVTLLKKDHAFYLIQMDDHYIGWIDSTSLQIKDQSGISQWDATKKIIITNLRGTVYAQPDVVSRPLSPIVAGCILKNCGKINGWVAIELANDQKGFLPDSLTEDLSIWKSSRTPTGVNLETTARSFLDIPYLWGGTSVRGMDCSGFTKMVYRFNGIELPRDADQQVLEGRHIDPGKNFGNLQKGDLLFFCQRSGKISAKRITHVALSLGNSLFIHSSGKVRLNSFDSTSNIFNESLLRRFVQARRIIKN